jgi:hypothetical protein
MAGQTNLIAYYDTATIADGKSFIVQAPGFVQFLIRIVSIGDVPGKANPIIKFESKFTRSFIRYNGKDSVQ